MRPRRPAVVGSDLGFEDAAERRETGGKRKGVTPGRLHVRVVGGVDQDVGLSGVAIFYIVRGELVVPLEVTGLWVEGEDAVREEVIAGAVAVERALPG